MTLGFGHPNVHNILVSRLACMGKVVVVVV